MDILAGLIDKLRFIERFYEAASHPFSEVKRKIEADEEPFASPPFDPETVDSEPPFLTEWQEADESLNLVGQAALSLVQIAFREYLDAFITSSRLDAPAGQGNWFERYSQFFSETYGIDWEKGPVPPEQLEEINLARNDIQHPDDAFGMTRRQSRKHQERFPGGLFIHEIDKELHRESPYPWSARIYITSANLSEAINRVERFCEFLEANRRGF